MTLTQPTKSTREWLAKHAEIVRHFERITHKRVSKFRHSKAYEQGVRASLSASLQSGAGK